MPKKKTEKTPVPDMKAEEIVVPMSFFDEPTEEDLLYFSTPYYDEILAKREQSKERLE